MLKKYTKIIHMTSFTYDGMYSVWKSGGSVSPFVVILDMQIQVFY